MGFNDEYLNYSIPTLRHVSRAHATNAFALCDFLHRAVPTGLLLARSPSLRRAPFPKAGINLNTEYNRDVSCRICIHDKERSVMEKESYEEGKGPCAVCNQIKFHTCAEIQKSRYLLLDMPNFTGYSFVK